MTVLQTGALPLGYRAILYSIQIHLFSDSDGNRTRVTAVKGRCLNRLTTEPYRFFAFPISLWVEQLRCSLAPRVGLEPTTTRLTAECSTIELSRKIFKGFVPSKPNTAFQPYRKTSSLSWLSF